MNNSTLITADRMTHIKIVVVALLASVAVIVVGIAARPQIDTSATAQIVKPGKPQLANDAATSSVR